MQLSSLLSDDELETLQRRIAWMTKEHMLRMLAEAMEILTAERPVILWLEDLQWSDASTLDWLAFVGRRQEPARLLVLGTYRPVDVLVREHPLKAVKQELQLHGQCEELALDFLHEEGIAEYLALRLLSRDRQGADGRPLADARGAEEAAAVRRLAQVIHHRTDGNPLFMVNLVDQWLSQEALVQMDGQWTLKGRRDQQQCLRLCSR